MDILEMGPGPSSHPLLMQQVVTQVQIYQMDTTPQCLFVQHLDHIFCYSQLLFKNKIKVNLGHIVIVSAFGFVK